LIVAKRLNWDKVAQMQKVTRHGSQPLYEDLPVFTGSPAEQRRIWKQRRKKKRAELIATQLPKRRVTRNSKLKVLRRRKNEGIIEVEKRKPS
jgi:hypothetical protein